jgi:signal transduction histidine kinase
MARFTVDTHLFRELGALLVGRDSTALVELIKNSYDADATSAFIYGEALGEPERGFIRISDDGVGMTPDEFNNGFLRVASRSREQGDRKSKKFNRRFTGAKGIGRLAAHKLARVVDIQSVSESSGEGNSRQVVEAKIDWDAVESQQTIEQLDDSAVVSTVQDAPSKSKPGTVITLRRLRGKWPKSQLGEFLGEVQTFEPPVILTTPLKKSCVPETLIFDQPTIRQTSNQDSGFRVKLEGEFAAGHEYWQTLLDVASWVVEISATAGNPTVRCVVAPTTRTIREFPSAKKQSFKVDHPDPELGPFFQARILIREGAFKGSTSERAWSRYASGIRVFMEGFRVLPYGEPKDDWLSLDADYARRSRSLPWLEGEEGTVGSDDKDAGLLVLPNRQYFGAVFLTQKGASDLKMLVNREGFVPDLSFQNFVSLIRKSIDLTTRVRASVKTVSRQSRKEKRATARIDKSSASAPPILTSVTQSLRNSMERATTLAHEARQFATTGDVARASKILLESVTQFEEAAKESQELISEIPMVRVLASVGTQMAAFIHEIRGLLGMAESLEAVVSRLRNDLNMPKSLKSEIARLHSSMGDLRRNLERQASYLVDVVTPDARRRRSRQSLSDRFEAGRRLVDHIAERRSIKIRNEIVPELKSPPMFQAELTTIFANLLTNAVKAAGEGGKIIAYASRSTNGSVRLVIENTGAKVDPEEGERWFRPFESTTTSADPVLGQGMGLGLPITRNMLEEYGAEIRFIAPSRGFSTSVEILFPD